MIEGDAFEQFRDDIRDKGVQIPIVTLGEFVLDGRNRLQAALALGLDCPAVEYDGKDPLGFVISANSERRHLTASQRAMAAAKLANMKQGHRSDLASQDAKSIRPVSQHQAAERMGVSRESVQRAKVVIDKVRNGEAVPELQRAVEDNVIPLKRAAQIAQAPKAQQAKRLAEATQPKAKVVPDDGPRPWPDELTEQLKAEIRAGSFSVDEFAERHRRHPRTVSTYASMARKLIEAEDDKLSATAEQKLEAYKRRARADLEVEFERRVSEEVKRRTDAAFPHLKEEQRGYLNVIEAARFRMTKDQARLIERCLHPDSRNSVSEETLTEAYQFFKSVEKLLCGP